MRIVRLAKKALLGRLLPLLWELMVAVFAVRKSTSNTCSIQFCVNGVNLDSKQRWDVTAGFLHDIESFVQGRCGVR